MSILEVVQDCPKEEAGIGGLIIILLGVLEKDDE